MVDLDEFTVTDATLEQMAGTANPRLKQIMEAAVRHMHAFVREVELTPAEWIQGLQFLTAVGQACTPLRQEFILLSDVLGVSAVVNALHDRKAKELGSQSSLLGPFFREGAPELPLGAQIVEKPTVEELVIHGQVTDTHGTPVPGALIQGGRPASADCTTCRSERRVDGHAWQFPHRYDRTLLLPDGAAEGILDPDGRPGGRPGARSGTAWDASLACAYADRGEGASRTGHRAVFRRRRLHRLGHGVWRVGLAGGGGERRSGLRR